MGYCCYMTQAGYALQAKLFAEGGNFEITRVMVGGGVCPEGTAPSQLTDLVEPMAQAASTKPVRAGCEVSLIIEYRSDLTPELEMPFQIKEFGVFAIGADDEEALVLWADLTTCPDTAVPLKYGGCVRRYPVNITVGPDASVSLAYPAGAWMTHEEAEALIQKALDEGLDMGGGISVPEAVGAVKDELDETREDLAGRLDAVKRAVDGSSFYRLFEPEEWQDGALRIPASEHGMAPQNPSCVCTLRQRLGRTAAEYDESSAVPVAGLILAAVKAALAANAVPETDPVPTVPPVRYPTAEDGHVILTWEQVQYLLLASTSFEDEGSTVWNLALVSAEQAAAKAKEEGFARWKERDNGVEPTVTLDELLSAAYLPALGAPSASFEVMVTAQAIQGLRFRRGTGGSGWIARYDLDGHFAATWGTMSCQACWDLTTKELVVRCDQPFAGDLLVMGPADTGEQDNVPECLGESKNTHAAGRNP